MAQQNRNKNKGTQNSQIVKYNSDKYKFQVITKKGTVLKYRDNQLSFNYVLQIDQIFGKTLNDIANDTDLQKYSVQLINLNVPKK